jgi:hypothetical protein
MSALRGIADGQFSGFRFIPENGYQTASSRCPRRAKSSNSHDHENWDFHISVGTSIRMSADENLTVLLLRGMDGTGELLAALVTRLSAYRSVQVIAYPIQRPLGYDELLDFELLTAVRKKPWGFDTGQRI